MDKIKNTDLSGDGFQRSGQILALDFDGVVADSIRECLVVAYNAFHEKSLIRNLEDMNERTAGEARRIRNYIRHSEDYLYIFLALQDGVRIEDQDEFDTFSQSRESRRRGYREAFYQYRTDLLQRDRPQWLALNPLFPGMSEFLKTYEELHQLYIVSTKKKEFIWEILQEAGIRFLPDHIRSATAEVSKNDILNEIVSESGKEAASLHFIDDQVDMLRHAQTVGVHCYHAGWGYCSEEQKALARQLHIPVLALDEFYTRFS